MSQSVEIRAMRTEDLDAVLSIQEQIIKQPVSEDWTEQLEGQVANRFNRCLVAVSEGQVVGFIMAEIRVGNFGDDCSGSLGYIGISPQAMGQGIGSSLAEALFEIFKQEGVTIVRTAVKWDSVDMLSFFKSIGFDRSKYINLFKRLD